MTGSSAYVACLAAEKFRLHVHLGITPQEREAPQAVEMDIRFYYPQLPDCCRNEDAPYSCYDKLCRDIKAHLERTEYRLIEAMAFRIYEMIRASTAEPVKLWVRLRKCAPPVPELLGGACFIYSDLPPGAWTVSTQ